jgi:phosphoserine phosphatase SerB
VTRHDTDGGADDRPGGASENRRLARFGQNLAQFRFSGNPVVSHILIEDRPEIVIRVYEQRLRINPGVERFVGACRDAGLRTLLVSGGFTFFSERIRHRLGLDFARANTLGLNNGVLTGKLVERPWGDVCDGNEKRRVVMEVCELMGIDPARAIAVGDGANDLPMMLFAGLSIAYHGKPAVRERASISIRSSSWPRAAGSSSSRTAPRLSRDWATPAIRARTRLSSASAPSRPRRRSAARWPGSAIRSCGSGCAAPRPAIPCRRAAPTSRAWFASAG